jgi:hypothetical protein
MPAKLEKSWCIEVIRIAWYEDEAAATSRCVVKTGKILVAQVSKLATGTHVNNGVVQ